jgi:methylenetetrahydrofolate reductase (NADPH)
MRVFRDELRKRDFVVTAECFLKPETNAESLRYQADTLRDHVDGIVLTDNQYGQTHMSTIAAARLLLDNGIDPIVQLSCRNRNRVALLADLLGACALDVTSVVLARGNRLPGSLKPWPKPVQDMKAAELIAMAANLKSDDRLKSAANLFIGGTISLHAIKSEWVPERITGKVDAGAKFLLANANLNLGVLRNYMSHFIATKLTRRVSVIVSTVILTSADDARWLRDRRPNITIPDSVVHRLENAADPQAEGFEICAEHLSLLAATPGVSGANIIASTDLAMIPKVIDAARLSET